MDSSETVYVHEGGADGIGPRITVLDKKGIIQARWDSPYGHQIWVDSRYDIYMAVYWEQRAMKYVRKG
jgi:hypothetical protein